MLGFTSNSFIRELISEVRSGYERTIAALVDHNQQLKNELEIQRVEHGETRQLLQRAMRLEPRMESQAGQARPRVEPFGQTKSWPKLQQELEQRHRRKPEDDAAKYWADKNAQMQMENHELDKTLGELEKQ